MTALVNAGAARTRVDRIKIAVEGAWQLIVESYQSRDWDVLGYATWDEMCTREFGTSRLRLPREERQEVVSSLREQGLSLRAISAATGVARNTLSADLRQVVQIEPPSEPVVTVEETSETSEQIDARLGPIGFEVDPVETPRVTGIDGKSYPAPAPRAPSRRPLPDEFRTASLELGRVAERITRLSRDDRFNKNADQISQSYLHDLIRARDALQCVIAQLQPEGA